MAFFSRPNLEDLQFKQVKNSTLTLSGETRIATTSGLTLNDGNGVYVPIIVTGATNFDVLTYFNGKIMLSPSNGSGGGVYSGASPTTCTVGGLISGSTIYGSNVANILEEILVPTLNPTLTNPSSTLSINPSDILYEVGSNINIDMTGTFDGGLISPAYCGVSGVRSGAVVCYDYHVWGAPQTYSSSWLTNTVSLSSHTITIGNNTISGCVYYASGVQPLNSSGGNYCSPLPSGHTQSNSINILGIYPYYYGTYSSNNACSGCDRPSGSASLIILGTKVVESSLSDICVNFNSAGDDYLWFAIPSTSTAKTIWYNSPINNGSIGGGISHGCNLFPNPISIANVSNGCWGGVTYNMYISNYQTEVTTIIELRNS